MRSLVTFILLPIWSRVSGSRPSSPYLAAMISRWRLGSMWMSFPTVSVSFFVEKASEGVCWLGSSSISPRVAEFSSPIGVSIDTVVADCAMSLLTAPSPSPVASQISWTVGSRSSSLDSPCWIRLSWLILASEWIGILIVRAWLPM